MAGITLRTYRQYYGLSKTVEDLKHITDAQWEAIYLKGYWQPLKLDAVKDQRIADVLADWAFMSGTATAAKAIQRLVDTKVDGIIGPMSIKAINEADGDELLDRLFKARRDFYCTIIAKRPANRVFQAGWNNRLEALKKYVGYK